METSAEELNIFLKMASEAFMPEIVGLHKTFVKTLENMGVNTDWVQLDESGVDKRLLPNIATIYLLGVLRSALNDDISEQVKGLYEDIKNAKKDPKVPEKE